MAPRVFALAEAVQGAPETAIIGLSACCLINGILVASGSVRGVVGIMSSIISEN